MNKEIMAYDEARYVDCAGYGASATDIQLMNVGFSKFDVVQANGFSCKIYNSSGKLVFDGSEYGNGTYRISVQNDCDLAINGATSYGTLDKTLSMQTWSVEPVLTLDMLQKISN